MYKFGPDGLCSLVHEDDEPAQSRCIDLFHLTDERDLESYVMLVRSTVGFAVLATVAAVRNAIVAFRVPAARSDCVTGIVAVISALAGVLGVFAHITGSDGGDGLAETLEVASSGRFDDARSEPQLTAHVWLTGMAALFAGAAMHGYLTYAVHTAAVRDSGRPEPVNMVPSSSQQTAMA
jgi:hypothetical protein